MGCVGCSKQCNCSLSAGDNVTVSGTGSSGTPYVISSTGGGGATGPTGPAGPTGATGVTGVTGPGGGSLYTIDNPTAFADAFGPSIGYDQEFNRTTNPTALPTGWTALNGNSGTYIEQAGRGTWHIPTGFNTINKTSIIARNIPVEGTWTAWGHAWAAWMGAGLCLTDGTKAVGVVWNPNPLILIATWSDITSAYFGNPAQENTGRVGHEYTRIKYAAANDISIAYGWDGHSWRYLLNNFDFPAYMGGFTPTKIGFCINQGGDAEDLAMDWFRVR